MEECPPKQWMKKQVRFKVEEELGNDPTLLLDLTTFLMGDDAPRPSTPLPLGLHGCLPTKAPSTIPLAQEGPSPRSQLNPPLLDPHHGSKGCCTQWPHPNQWILAEMNRARVNPHWWKDIRASKRLTMGSVTMRECLNTPEALHYAWWQVAAFRLPLTQQEALGWWEASPWLCRVCPQDFLPNTEASGTRDFWTVRGENPGLSPCTAGLCRKVRVPTRVLCDVAWELQRCIAPLLRLSRDNIVEASLLNPQARNVEPPPHQRRKPSSWVRNLSCWRPQRLHIKTWLPPLPEDKEIPVSDWSPPDPHYWVDQDLCGERQKGTWLVEGNSGLYSALILVYTLL